jgi:hypothetical protein
MPDVSKNKTANRAALLRWPKRISMKIRAGYEISYDCPQATPMILTLYKCPSVTLSRSTDPGPHAARSAHPH